MVLIKGSEQDPDLGVKIVHPSVDDDRKATDSDKEESKNENSPETTYDDENMNAPSSNEGNNEEDDPRTPYDGENINAYSNNEENNDEVAPEPPTNNEIINANSDNVTPDTPTNGGDNETMDNDEEKDNEK